MRIFRFVILGLVGIGFVRSSGGGVDFLGDDHSRLSQECRAELQNIHRHWEWMVSGFAGWTSTGNVELEMENKARTLGLLEFFFEESRKSFERKFPAATDGGVEKKAFDSEIENAYKELNEVWDEPNCFPHSHRKFQKPLITETDQISHNDIFECSCDTEAC